MIFSAVTRTVTLRFTCENCANSLSASMGMCPSSSWQQSLSDEQSQSRTRPRNKSDKRPKKKMCMTHGSGECMGAEEWRMYCVHWNTRKAKLLRKSLADSRPATGRNWKPVLSAGKRTHRYILFKNLECTPFVRSAD